ncbi:MAG: hypothetical protein H6843_11980 [Rhodospirillaceae bacterium]|nr:hypothetical protein [Rhodospirillaceae bacterium]
MTFETSIFINCPFDEDYEPILQALLFCAVYAGLTPRLAKERSDSGEYRLDKIIELIESSKLSVHDLSRCQAGAVGEHYRLNMPFELGIDYAYRRFAKGEHGSKKILILEEHPFRYRAALSDIAGLDIKDHNGDYQKAVKQLRNWLALNCGLRLPGPSRILDAYDDFQEWNWKRLRAESWSDPDIRERQTNELLADMQAWMAAGQPL